MDWLSDYLYRKEITITHQTGSGTDQQIKLLIGKTSDAVGEDFNLEGHCLDTFADVRFTDNDETTELKYWIESVVSSGGTYLATVWVKVTDDLSSSDVSIYCYYGKGGDTTTSNGDDTFILFDHFEGASLDTDKWSAQSGTVVSVGSSIFRGYGSANYGGFRSADAISLSGWVKIEALVACANVTGQQNAVGFIETAEATTWYGVNSAIIRYTKAAGRWQDWQITAYNARGIAVDADYHRYTIKSKQGSPSTMLFDNANSYTFGGNLGTDTYYAWILKTYNTSGSDKYSDIDWAFVRKSNATEPAFSGAGDEEEEVGAETNMKLNINDTLKTVSGVKLNIGDNWKTVTKAKVNVGDSWRDIF